MAGFWREEGFSQEKYAMHPILQTGTAKQGQAKQKG